MKERKEMVSKGENLSVRKQSELLEVNRSSLYYKPLGESKENLEIMCQMDKIYLQSPTYGVLRMQDELEEYGYYANEKRVRRLMRKMGLEAIYPKKNLSRLGQTSYIQPYLLKGLNIDRPNQVWMIDISYIAMRQGFMYLTAVIDVYSRYIVGWNLSNSLAKEIQTELINECIKKHGKPQIINSDQGSQYTSKEWANCLQQHQIRISMDGKGRAIDNVYVERFFRTIKQDYVYLNPAKDGLELYEGIKNYIHRYNHRRHQGIGRIKPINKYKQVA
ncbi:MAG: IS3 family transposase [Bacteroidetes bacterium]|nr:IS3 family transposase [Bacteroidota bacterium]MCB9328275.1 IS3 family transposase [Lewinellaceae bacterium]